jgi:hypothetical protein
MIRANRLTLAFLGAVRSDKPCHYLTRPRCVSVFHSPPCAEKAIYQTTWSVFPAPMKRLLEIPASNPLETL